MSTYYLRAIEQDWPNLISLGEALGVIASTPDGHGIGTGWVYIGPLMQPTGQTRIDDMGDTVPAYDWIRDESGNRYIHANLTINVSLRTLATEAAQSNPAIAAALADLSKYFLCDADGNPRAPANPAVSLFQC